MFAAIGSALLGLVLGCSMRAALAAGRWRRDTDQTPVPPFWWVIVAAPTVLALVGFHVSRLSWWTVPAYLMLATTGVLLAAVDADVHRLPDNITLPSLPIIGALLALAAGGIGDWSRMLMAVLCGAISAAAFLTLALAVPSGLGLGDVKLSALLGLALGWFGAFTVFSWIFFGFLLGGLWALALLITRRANRTTHVAFGPPLLLGALVALLGVQTL